MRTRVFDIPFNFDQRFECCQVKMTTIYSAAPSAVFPQNAQAGPSKGSNRKKLPLPPASQAPLALAPKRKRNETPEETSADSTSSQPPRRSITRRDGPKKKKASRACYHCQKAHLTCDDCNPNYSISHDPMLTVCPARPCQRCIKRGISDNCTEGHRKKAKYLLDEDELGTHQLILISINYPRVCTRAVET
jgi:hypothetical protein